MKSRDSSNTGERIDDCIAPPRVSNKKIVRQHPSQAIDCQRSLLRLCSALCFCLAKFTDGHVISVISIDICHSLLSSQIMALQLTLSCFCLCQSRSMTSSVHVDSDSKVLPPLKLLYGRCQVYKGSKAVCTTSKVSSPFASQSKRRSKAEECSNLPTAGQ